MKRSDLMVVASVTVVVLLVSLALLARQRLNRPKKQRIACVNNLKQVGLSFRIFANGSRDLYPMGTPIQFGGAKEAVMTGGVWKVFQVMSNELSDPKTVVCPADTQIPTSTEWQTLSNTNTSYFVGLDAEDTRPDMLLSGDRNLAVNGDLLSGVVALGTNSPAGWTPSLHRNVGNIGLADGSVQQVTTDLLRQQLMNSGDASNRVAFPQ
jgi:hypothetical protein